MPLRQVTLTTTFRSERAREGPDHQPRHLAGGTAVCGAGLGSGHAAGQNGAGPPEWRPAGSGIEGRLWQGSARWQWQALSGGLRWDTSWRGLSFGADLTVSGDIVATGWLGAAPAGVTLADMDIVVPVAPLVQGMPNVSAEGLATVRGLDLQWWDGAPHGAQAVLSYSGGRVSWARGQGADIPVLSGSLRQDGEAAVFEVRSPDSVLLADGQLTKESARMRVYRAWPALLGVSQGGSPTDVVFETSQQLAP